MVSGKSARAEMTAPLSTPRRAMPESLTPASSSAIAAVRVSGSLSIGWRSSTFSWSDMRTFAQCTAPKPIPSSAKAMARPSASVDRRTPAVVPSGGMTKYTTSATIVPIAEMPKSVATCRSARFAARGSRSAWRLLCSGRPGSGNVSREPCCSRCPTSRCEDSGDRGFW